MLKLCPEYKNTALTYKNLVINNCRLVVHNFLTASFVNTNNSAPNVIAGNAIFPVVVYYDPAKDTNTSKINPSTLPSIPLSTTITEAI